MPNKCFASWTSFLFLGWQELGINLSKEMKSTNGASFSRDNMAGVCLHILKLGKAFLDMTQNLPVTKGKLNKLGLSKLKTLSKDTINWKYNPRNGRKYPQITYLLKDYIQNK